MASAESIADASILTYQEVDSINIVEKTCSSLSLIGSYFIIISYLRSERFDRAVNRLIFMASMGNALTSMATISTRQVVKHPNSVQCQLQAFVLQMCLPADAYWTLAMACNVYLTFNWRYDAVRLRKMELLYFASCYGLPFIPAIAYLWLSVPGAEQVYGDATLWCWISVGKWDYLRIATFYGPVWICMMVATLIYVRTGRQIYLKRRALKKLSSNITHAQSTRSDKLWDELQTSILVTREVEVQEECVTIQNHTISNDSAVAASRVKAETDGLQFSQTRPLSCDASCIPIGLAVVTNAISGGAPGDWNRACKRRHRELCELARAEALREAENRAFQRYSHFDSIHTDHEPHHGSERELDFEAGPVPEGTVTTNNLTGSDRAAWVYTKVAVLFFLSMAVTWIPSSANRVYSLYNRGQVDSRLEVASSAVLPLQGVWNTIIYIMTNPEASRAAGISWGMFYVRLFKLLTFWSFWAKLLKKRAAKKPQCAHEEEMVDDWEAPSPRYIETSHRLATPPEVSASRDQLSSREGTIYSQPLTLVRSETSFTTRWLPHNLSPKNSTSSLRYDVEQ